MFAIWVLVLAGWVTLVLVVVVLLVVIRFAGCFPVACWRWLSYGFCVAFVFVLVVLDLLVCFA